MSRSAPILYPVTEIAELAEAEMRNADDMLPRTPVEAVLVPFIYRLSNQLVPKRLVLPECPMIPIPFALPVWVVPVNRPS